MPLPEAEVAELSAKSTAAPAKPAQEEICPILPLIDGRPAGGTGNQALLLDPANGQPLARVAFAGTDDIEMAAESAARTAALWRSTPFEERRRALRKLAALIYEQSAAIAKLVAREQGKPFVEALNLEILPALDHLQFLIRQSAQYHSPSELHPRHPFYAHKHAHYLFDPLGVVVLVTPYPLPFALPLIQVAAALVMGNAVVLKPSEQTPLSSLRIGELCMQAGLPPGLVNVVPSHPEEVLHLVTHRKVDKVFVTGSPNAGQHVMATAGCTPRPVVLCLAGKHPSVVAGDADVQRAARGVVWGALANCGQNCGAVERVYVEESIASRFIERVLAEVQGIRVGSPLAESTDMGPLISERRRQEVHAHVMEAVAGGAQLLSGGVLPEGPGFFYPPTVLLDPSQECRVMREETLGPVIPIVVVESLERAILLANDSDYALTASGWTRSSDKAERMMVGLQAGAVTINDVLYSYGEPASTWSGYRKSGIGQNHGTSGLREMCRQRFVSYDSQAAEAPLFAFPYDGDAEAIARAAIDFLHGKNRFRRLRSLLRLSGKRRFRARIKTRRLFLPRSRYDK